MPIPEMSLLTPSEFVRFQSFLTSIDQGEDSVLAPEWSLYSPGGTHSQQLQPNESLAKATKDLISLEPSPISHDSLAVWQSSPTASESPHFVPHQARHQSFSQQSPPNFHPPIHHDRRYSDYDYRYTHQVQRPPPEPFPFLKPQEYQPYIVPHAQRQSTSDLMGRSLPLLDTSAPQPSLLHPGSRPSGGAAGLTPPSSATSASPPPSHSSRPSPPAAPSASTSKRNLDGPPSISGQAPKRSRGSVSGQKPALLSPSQKKANHIQSEQKRRANIRRGYDALCETVPELREAIREEEAALVADGTQGKPRPKRTKASKPRGEDGMDKSDGRAGPRSENVVLSKTIDYIHDLLAERENLTTRLTRARSLLPPDHPALVPTREPLWEREWTGGTGKTADDDDEGDEDDHS